MRTLEVGAQEIAGKIDALINAVSRGQRVVITNNQKAVAELIRVGQYKNRSREDIDKVIQEMREIRQGNILGDDLTIRDLVEDGRRH